MGKKLELNKWEDAHRRNIEAYGRQIDEVFRSAAREAAMIASVAVDFRPEKPFSFADYPATRRRVEKLLSGLENSLTTVIVNGVKAEWTLANNKNSELANQVFGDNASQLTEEQSRRYYTNNDSAREAFISRKTDGLKLSDRVWKYTQQFKTEIELGIDIGLREGRSADELSRDLRQYLQYPDKLFRRVRDEHGNLVLSKEAKSFHPGRGVYRSSYKNARRLAATETNIAYRTSDHLRWQQFDFVVGQRVMLSNNHTLNGQPFDDICDQLSAPLGSQATSGRGCYPKDFKFTGWHPLCRCHVEAILKTEKEMAEDNRRIMAGEDVSEESVNTVRDVPENFNEWVENNKERAKGWSSMPYFIRQNPQYVKGFEVDTYTKAERKFTRARRTNEAMKESLGIFLQSKYPELQNTEKAAIFHYTRGEGAAFRQLNNQLRKGNLSEFNEAFSGLLSQGLSKLGTTTETVYRSMRLNKTNLREFVRLASQSGETTFKGFTSGSLDRMTAVEFGDKHTGRKSNEIDVLLVIKGKSGHPIEDLSQFGGRFKGKPNQREVLFDKGMRFRFESVSTEDGIQVFYLTEV